MNEKIENYLQNCALITTLWYHWPFFFEIHIKLAANNSRSHVVEENMILKKLETNNNSWSICRQYCVNAGSSSFHGRCRRVVYCQIMRIFVDNTTVLQHTLFCTQINFQCRLIAHCFIFAKYVSVLHSIFFLLNQQNLF